MTRNAGRWVGIVGGRMAISSAGLKSIRWRSTPPILGFQG